MARARPQAWRPRLDDLPLFADDLAIGAVLLGTGRAAEWPNLVPMYERRGFPKVDPVMGGRYVPAVKAFFDVEYGISSVRMSAPDGGERPWKESRRRA
jgi:hypothetical protein